MVRNFLLTINNPEQSEKEFFEYCKNLPNIKYFIFQREKGEETGTEHYQMYIEFEFGKRFETMKKYFPRAHIEARRDSKEACRKYCSKTETRIGEVYEFGTFAEERERTDWTDAKAIIDNGGTPEDVCDNNAKLYFQNQMAIERYYYKYLLRTKLGDFRKLDEVVYIYGGPRVGKTRYVRDKYGFQNVFRMSAYGNINQDERFDSYTGQDILLFEEFRSSIKLDHMLIYLDDYFPELPARIQNKVGLYTKVYICTNVPLTAQYRTQQTAETATWRAFLSRITAVYNFNWSKDIAVPRHLWFAPEEVLKKVSKGKQIEISSF